MTRLLLLAPLSLLLSGCLGDLIEFSCMFSDDPDHCYQAAAVQGGEPDDCEKVTGAGFSGNNPPKDKCFLQIAENTGDPSVCDEIVGGMMSYSQDECLRNVLANHGPEECEKAANPQACRDAYARNGRGCGEGFIVIEGNCAPKPPESSSSAAGQGSDDDIESKVEQDLNTLKDAATGKYMELLEKAIEDEDDDAKKRGLEAYKEFLEKSGSALEDVQTTVDQLKEIKRIFLDSYDPSMDIDKMPVNKILDPGLFDKIQERIFGADEPTERSKAEDALTVYQKMLERQGEIDFLQQGRLQRLKDVVSSKVKDDLSGQVKDRATEIAEGIAGTAFVAVGIVDHALTSFQEGAQQEMFVGLAAAYNRQRQAIEQSNPNLTPEQVHARTVQQVKEDPYQDVPNAGFVKYGNLLENKDCQDEGNPLCIDNRVFWTAMDKTWDYQHRKR